MIIPDNHPSVTCGEKIAEWTERNLRWLGPESLSFNRIICNRGIISLNSQPKWHQAYWDAECQNNVYARLEHTGFNTWGTGRNLHKEKLLAKQHNIGHKVDIISITDHEAYILSFDVNDTNKLNIAYNNLSRLYLAQAELTYISTELEAEHKAAIYLPLETPSTFDKPTKSATFNSCKKYTFGYATLKLRELQCICLRISGISYKEIGALLNISYDTVKEYITTIIKRYNISNSHQSLLEFTISTGIYKCSDEFVIPLLQSKT